MSWTDYVVLLKDPNNPISLGMIISVNINPDSIKTWHIC